MPVAKYIVVKCEVINGNSIVEYGPTRLGNIKTLKKKERKKAKVPGCVLIYLFH